MEALAHPGQHPEGRFLPGTYAYTRGDSDLDLLGRAHDALDKALDAAWQSRDADLPLASKEEALVLASIVEKETGIADERPQIAGVFRSEEHTSELQSLMRISYAVFCLQKKNIKLQHINHTISPDSA